MGELKDEGVERISSHDLSELMKVTASQIRQYYVSVRGGKWTGYKWLWVNDGHFSQKGNWVKGTHFVDKAEAAADNGINEIVDEYLKEALEDNG